MFRSVNYSAVTCSVVPGTRVNLIIRSTADVVCEFDNAGTIEKYKGETGIGLGLDLSLKTEETMHFAVFTASSDVTMGRVMLWPVNTSVVNCQLLLVLVWALRH